MRREQAQRLKETMVKRKQERKFQQETELQELEKMIEAHNGGNNLNQFKVILYFNLNKKNCL